MMRPIKFRAWINEDDPEYSRMVYSEQAVLTAIRHVYGGKGVANQAGFSDCCNQPKPERYVLMQYTGLKDGNGMEIYEGDIVAEQDVDGIFTWVVKWDKKEALFKIESLSDTFFGGDMLEVFALSAIIGNIYDSPELLEEAGSDV